MRLSHLFSFLPVVQAYVISAPQAVRQDVVVGLQDEMLGMGVHFTASYAAVAVRYADGRVEDFLRVPAGEEWIAAMGRWAGGQNGKCVTPREKIWCGIKQGMRWWNTWLGLHPTNDVATLSAFMQEVKEEIAAKFQHQRLPIAVLHVFPILPALDDQDIRDALKYSGLGTQSSHIFLETNAAFAGLGNGLCTTWKDAYQCAKEEAAMKPETDIFLSFDNSSFSATLQTISTSYPSPDPSTLRSTLDVQLGWDSLPIYEVARAKFWARIQETVTEIVSQVETVDRVILMGEFGRDDELWEVVKGALEGRCRDGETIVHVDIRREGGRVVNRGWMTAARGAAEIAWRAGARWRAEGAALEDEDEVLEL